MVIAKTESDLPNLREQTILHAARCAKAATTQRDRQYWSKIAKDALETYRAAGGKRIQLGETADRWTFKVSNPEWLTPREKASLKPGTQVIEEQRQELRRAYGTAAIFSGWGTAEDQAAIEQEIREAEREVHEAGTELRDRMQQRGRRA